MTHDETLKLMDEFAQAFNRHDRQALESMMTPDGVFEASMGPEAFGTRYSGREAVGNAFAAVWETYPDATWDNARHTAAGDRGFSEWTFRGTDAKGNRVEVNGVDLFVFRDGRIARKDSFRKTRIS
jgi:ketosteroid isomerase-like protein